MSGKRFYVVLSFIVLAVLALGISLYLYNKPHVNIEKSEPEYFLTAQELITEYQKHEIETDKKYSERILQVKGQINEISINKDKSVIVLKPTGEVSSVICHMLPVENTKLLKLEKGDMVTIKGKCTGYLLDVIMVRCILEE
ncbi:hypothetical protein HCG49_13320 [Arenibacter sp. 6A1]|uniref:OB-fold protein n=1 Tax=Arenibacter sp. 6A1 TaxID=2720391 RepID=UPI001447EB0C|nr:hypothetical protein [Arenibacter sp. 6A1]NKI27544.1 hypothetical protein [Arenibacter sp. 6A1]